MIMSGHHSCDNFDPALNLGHEWCLVDFHRGELQPSCLPCSDSPGYGADSAALRLE